MKDKINILGLALTVFVIAACIKMYTESDSYNLKCIVSDVDNKKYCVREKDKLHETADLLAKVTNKLKQIVDLAYEKYPKNENVVTLYERLTQVK